MQNTSETGKKKSFLNYINVFRGLAILLIVAGHSMQIGAQNSLAHIIWCEIVCGGTALFIFISGFLFEHLSGKFEYKNYLSKKWINVIIPYLITAIPGLLFCFYLPSLYKNSFDGMNVLMQIPLLLSIGRVHNTPTWFIPMIILFFICSFMLLRLEKKKVLYKLLPVMFAVTIFLQRGEIEYEQMLNLSYMERYFTYLKYIFTGFIHFFSLYVFGMYCSKYKEIIDKFYNKRLILWVLTLFTAGLNIYLSKEGIYSNYTVSKVFFTMLLLGYLKHYDGYILSHNKTNKTLDFIAKYSFGIFFIHWYWIFVYNQIFNLKGVIPIDGNISLVLAFVIIFVRFLAVTTLSIFTLWGLKTLLLKINEKINTRMFLGV